MFLQEATKGLKMYTGIIEMILLSLWKRFEIAKKHVVVYMRILPWWYSYASCGPEEMEFKS